MLREKLMNETTPNSAGARDIAYHVHPFTSPRQHEVNGPLIIERGEGIHVYDDAGNRYIEGLAGLACVGLGWGEERLVEAAAAQMKKLAFIQSFTHRSHTPAIDLSEKLVEITPRRLTRVFFANSGSEANDTAVKLIWFRNAAVGKPEKRKIITQLKGYHGTTAVSASMTGLPHVHAGFGLPLPGFLHVETPHYYHNGREGESEEDFTSRLARQLDELIEEEGPETVAAFFAEPVLASGGTIVPPPSYYPKVERVLKKHDVLMVADEVICGFGRTGRMFGAEALEIEPDMMVVAKQLSSAYIPISAVLMSDAIYEGLKEGDDPSAIVGTGFTYSAHPVAAAVALETLAIYEERGLVDHAARMGVHMQARLAELVDHPIVGEVRGIGLMAGVEIVKDKRRRTNFAAASKVGATCTARVMAHGLISRAGQNDTMGLSPPLIITEPEIDTMVDMLRHALDDTAQWIDTTNPD